MCETIEAQIERLAVGFGSYRNRTLNFTAHVTHEVVPDQKPRKGRVGDEVSHLSSASPVWSISCQQPVWGDPVWGDLEPGNLRAKGSWLAQDPSCIPTLVVKDGSSRVVTSLVRWAPNRGSLFTQFFVKYFLYHSVRNRFE